LGTRLRSGIEYHGDEPLYLKILLWASVYILAMLTSPADQVIRAEIFNAQPIPDILLFSIH
jgi:hypothetical protein